MVSEPVVSLVGGGHESTRGQRTVREVEDAVRRLVELARDLSWEDDSTGVLLDIVVGGTRCVVTASRPSAAGPRTAAPASIMLSPREHEIARMVASGYTTKEIATVLEISSWTVSTHLRRVFGKLDVGTRAAMVARLFAADGGPTGIAEDTDARPLPSRLQRRELGQPP